jgi:hypothetical protein
MKGFILIVAAAAVFHLVVVLGFFVYRGYVVETRCLQYLKQAADANTVDIAKDSMDKALAFIDAQQWQAGNTGIILSQPKNDVGFWAKNLRGAKKELDDVRPDATPLERSNMLMKLRETLLDNDSKGTTITHPGGISLFPYQVVAWIWFIVALLMAIGGVFGFVVVANDNGYL